jgi:putative oxidoreductase
MTTVKYILRSMKHIPTIAGILLGLVFLVASVPFLLHMAPNPQFPEGTPIAHFMAAMNPTGYMTFVKVFELIGGILVMIPRLRNIGLLILGPIIVNILASTQFVMGGGAAFGNPLIIVVVVCALYLLWSARARFAGLLN